MRKTVTFLYIHCYNLVIMLLFICHRINKTFQTPNDKRKAIVHILSKLNLQACLGSGDKLKVVFNLMLKFVDQPQKVLETETKNKRSTLAYRG